MTQVHLKVECVSDRMYAGRPLALTLDGERYVVESVEKEWLGPDGRHYRVSCAGGNRFELVYKEAEDEWRLEEA